MNRPRLSQRAAQVKPSATLAITAKAAQMRAAGEKVLPLSAGEPDFPTPAHIRRAAVEAMEAGHTGYSPSAGIPPLRAALRKFGAERLGLEYSDAQVVVGCGAKQCLANAMLALLDPGDEVIVPSPYWVSYPEQVRLCGAEPVFLPPRPDGGLDTAALRKAVTPRTRMLVLNSPSNPSGRIVDEDALRQVAQVVEAGQLTVLSDDIYDRIVFDGLRCPHLLQVAPQLRDRVIAVNGLSKAYSMTGWRLGWALGPAEVIAAMRSLQDQTTSNAVTFVQHAALAALASPPQVVDEMVVEIEKRRDRLLALLGGIKGLSALRPEGAFYVMVDLKAILGRKFGGRRVVSGVDFAEVLLESAKVAVVPGEPFGAPGWIRLSFATSLPAIEEAVARIASMVEKPE